LPGIKKRPRKNRDHDYLHYNKKMQNNQPKKRRQRRPGQLATTSRIADNLGNRDILVQQEIIFTVARLVRTSASSQCHNGKQCQHYFFHFTSPFLQKARLL